jgi:hypothetical protein
MHMPPDYANTDSANMADHRTGSTLPQPERVMTNVVDTILGTAPAEGANVSALP